jgi:hypothetical protein
LLGVDAEIMVRRPNILNIEGGPLI